MTMRAVLFNTKDAEILYSFPKQASDLSTIIRCFMFINRVATPTYDEVASCFAKARKAGILSDVGGKLSLNPEWYSRVHASDGNADNEIESLLEFEETFVGCPFPEVFDFVNELSKDEFEAAIRGI